MFWVVRSERDGGQSRVAGDLSDVKQEVNAMSDCIFCKICAGTLPADVVYEDDHCLVFRDIQPKAPVHLLVIPRKHVESLDNLMDEDRDLASHLLMTIPRVARQQGLDGGYRTVVNTGKDGGQEVFHLHFHILGGGVPKPL